MTPSFSSPARRIAFLLAAAAVMATACSSKSATTSGAPTTAVTAAATPTTSNTACRSTAAGTSNGGPGDVVVPGDISDTVKYVTYHAPDGYHLDHPEGFAQQATGTTVTFTDKFNSIRVETVAAPTAPSIASAQTIEVPEIRSAASCFEPGKVSQVSRHSGPAILITYRVNSPADPVTGKVVLQDVERYEFWQAGRQATITLSSPKGSDNVDPWRRVTDSFGWGA